MAHFLVSSSVRMDTQRFGGGGGKIFIIPLPLLLTLARLGAPLSPNAYKRAPVFYFFHIAKAVGSTGIDAMSVNVD